MLVLSFICYINNTLSLHFGDFLVCFSFLVRCFLLYTSGVLRGAFLIRPVYYLSKKKICYINNTTYGSDEIMLMLAIGGK